VTPTVALVTGAGSGMGKFAAHRLAERGVVVAGLDVNEAGLAETAAADAARVHPYPCDVTDQAAVETTVARIEADHGPIDRVMNAAGMAVVGSLLGQSPTEIMRVMQVNYGGTVNVTAATLPAMLERGRGELVNFASLAGWIPQPKMGAYCATKFAVVAYSEALWMENRGRGVRFACVCPPAVSTPMLPDFFAEPDDQRKARPITAEQVIDAVEHALEKDRFLVLPRPSAKMLWRVRRFTPRLLRRVLSSERFDLISAS
jgi:short-subunit dehydrogenase